MSWEQDLDDKVNRDLDALKKDRDRYDEETEVQLKEVRDSDWHTTRYLREIIWELRYMRGKADRP